MSIPKKFLRLMADVYTVAVLLLSSQAFVTVFVSPDSTTQLNDGSPFFKAAWGLVYFITLIRMIRCWRDAKDLLERNKALIVLLILALGSALWSLATTVTLHQTLTLIFSAAFALDMALRYSLQGQLRLLSITLVLAVALSVVAEIALPGVIPGREFEQPAWHGIFGWKNDFGRIICLTVLVCLTTVRPTWWRKITLVAFGIALSVLCRSVSAAGYILIIASISELLPFLRAKRSTRSLVLGTAIAGVVLVAYIGYRNLNPAMSLVGKDARLSGRVDLWQLATGNIADKPLLGYGYGAFWSADSQEAQRIREASNWKDAPHAHNGYIDLVLSLGFTGLFAYLWLFGLVARRAYETLLAGPEQYRRWPLSYLAFVCLYQFTESGIVAGNELLWILFCALAFSLAPSLAKRQLKTAEDGIKTPVYA